MAELNIDIVAVDRKIWSGQGTFLFTRTTSGEIGILPNHIPLVAQLVDDAMVRVEREGENDLRIAVDGGFLSVTEQGVTVLAESAEFDSEIDEAAAQARRRIRRSRYRRQGSSEASRPGPDRLAGPPMSASMMLMVALVGVLLFVVVALSYRLWKLRQVGGTAAILRDVPAVGGHGWRHGVMRYRGGEAGFYRLSSLRWWPDRRLSRRGLEIVSRRSPRGDEFDIMTDEIVVLELRDTSPERRRGYEVALDRGALTAFLSWLESRPSPRARRRTF